ncbi:MAG: sulfoxide reductase heme-binding subunit YedZ [Flavobacteriales bacterium]|jgi:sulfoxide reductase heme-binding subunit YedZ
MTALKSKRLLKKTVKITLKLVTHTACLSPIIWLVYAVPAGLFGGDPVKELIHYFGLGSLRLLLLTLVITPFARILSIKAILVLRRPLGLWAFAWASLHFASWLYLDLAFDWSLIGDELLKRNFIIIGFIVWASMATLAFTSIPKLIKMMGKRWQKLHGVIYFLVILTCLHFWMSLKSGWLEPAIYLCITVVLLALRKKKVMQWAISFKTQQK